MEVFAIWLVDCIGISSMWVGSVYYAETALLFGVEFIMCLSQGNALSP